jgi:glycerol-3-phosphate acyltransferase PlsY
MFTSDLIIVAFIGYLIGSIPFGWLVARAKGLNIFQYGSGSSGATNVGRVLGEKFGLPGKRLGQLVFLLDAAKGSVAAGWPMLLSLLGMSNPDFFADKIPLLAVASLAGALLGHSYSIFTKFRGGKGVATTAGGFLVLMPLVIMIGVGVWIVTFYSTRYVSLASMLAAVSLPTAALILGEPPLLTGLATGIAIFVVWRHRANIVRLLNGTESKFARRLAENDSAPS